MGYDLCYSELDRAGIILTTGLCGRRGYVLPKTRKSAVLEKSQKNKKCLKNSKIQLFDRHTLSQSPTFVSNVKVPQKRVNRLRLKKHIVYLFKLLKSKNELENFNWYSLHVILDTNGCGLENVKNLTTV